MEVLPYSSKAEILATSWPDQSFEKKTGSIKRKYLSNNRYVEQLQPVTCPRKEELDLVEFFLACDQEKDSKCVRENILILDSDENDSVRFSVDYSEL